MKSFCCKKHNDFYSESGSIILVRALCTKHFIIKQNTAKGENSCFERSLVENLSSQQ